MREKKKLYKWQTTHAQEKKKEKKGSTPRDISSADPPKPQKEENEQDDPNNPKGDFKLSVVTLRTGNGYFTGPIPYRELGNGAYQCNVHPAKYRTYRPMILKFGSYLAAAGAASFLLHIFALSLLPQRKKGAK